jgi:hypothetical protein
VKFIEGFSFHSGGNKVGEYGFNFRTKFTCFNPHDCSGKSHLHGNPGNKQAILLLATACSLLHRPSRSIAVCCVHSRFHLIRFWTRQAEIPCHRFLSVYGMVTFTFPVSHRARTRMLSEEYPNRAAGLKGNGFPYEYLPSLLSSAKTLSEYAPGRSFQKTNVESLPANVDMGARFFSIFRAWMMIGFFPGRLSVILPLMDP